MGANIAIIPARGGSKRLPRKNIKEFLGKPIIFYTIEAARNSGLFEKVVVSTEDAEIKRRVEGSGCEIHQRGLHLATDTARVVDVIKDVLEDYRRRAGLAFEYLCCLYPTTPLRDAADIQNSYRLLLENCAEFCLAVSDYDYSPFFAFDIEANGRIQRRWPDLAKLPAWQKPRVVADNGAIYWARVPSFLEKGELEGENAVGYLMPKRRAIDIDTEEDFALAEQIAKTLMK